MTRAPLLEQEATPAKVRRALREAGAPYDIQKVGGSWLVVGGASTSWFSASLNTYRIGADGRTVGWWLGAIVSMEKENMDR